MDEKRLAHEGEDEMVELAERFQNRFPQILPDVYTNSTFKVQSTNIILLIRVCNVNIFHFLYVFHSSTVPVYCDAAHY